MQSKWCCITGKAWKNPHFPPCNERREILIDLYKHTKEIACYSGLKAGGGGGGNMFVSRLVFILPIFSCLQVAETVKALAWLNVEFGGEARRGEHGSNTLLPLGAGGRWPPLLGKPPELVLAGRMVAFLSSAWENEHSQRTSWPSALRTRSGAFPEGILGVAEMPRRNQLRAPSLVFIGGSLYTMFLEM